MLSFRKFLKLESASILTAKNLPLLIKDTADVYLKVLESKRKNGFTIPNYMGINTNNINELANFIDKEVNRNDNDVNDLFGSVSSQPYQPGTLVQVLKQLNTSGDLNKTFVDFMHKIEKEISYYKVGHYQDIFRKMALNMEELATLKQ